MKKTLKYYELNGGHPFYDQIEIQFPKNVSKYGIPYFHENDPLEDQFQAFCTANSIDFNIKTLITHSGRLALEDSHYYLSLKSTNEQPQLQKSHLEAARKKKCSCCGLGLAPEINSTIYSKYQKSIALNHIVEFNGCVSPKLLLISQDLLKEFEAQKITGYKIFQKSTLGDSFLIKVEHTVKKPPCIGDLIRSKKCSKCQSITLFESSHEYRFSKESLLDFDFQYIDSFYTNDGIINHTQFEEIIVSRKLMKLLKDQKAKGLKNYSDDIPAKLCSVIIENKPKVKKMNAQTNQ